MMYILALLRPSRTPPCLIVYLDKPICSDLFLYIFYLHNGVCLILSKRRCIPVRDKPSVTSWICSSRGSRKRRKNRHVYIWACHLVTQSSIFIRHRHSHKLYHWVCVCVCERNHTCVHACVWIWNKETAHFIYRLIKCNHTVCFCKRVKYGETHQQS